MHKSAIFFPPPLFREFLYVCVCPLSPRLSNTLFPPNKKTGRARPRVFISSHSRQAGPFTSPSIPVCDPYLLLCPFLVGTRNLCSSVMYPMELSSIPPLLLGFPALQLCFLYPVHLLSAESSRNPWYWLFPGQFGVHFFPVAGSFRVQGLRFCYVVRTGLHPCLSLLRFY